MKLFRRALLAVMLGIMAGSLAFFLLIRQTEMENYDGAFGAFDFVVSLICVPIWSVICMEKEPNLTRVALISESLAIATMTGLIMLNSFSS
jgi:hypothetical protein